MLCIEIIAVLFSDPHKTVWEEYIIAYVTAGGTYSDHWVLEG
jgi:hypothetical protein